MPEMDAFEMVRRIRETDGETPILFASALTSPKDVRHGYKLGVNNYVKKPFVPEEIDAHIHAILKMKAGARAGQKKDVASSATTRSTPGMPPCATTTPEVSFH